MLGYPDQSFAAGEFYRILYYYFQTFDRQDDTSKAHRNMILEQARKTKSVIPNDLVRWKAIVAMIDARISHLLFLHCANIQIGKVVCPEWLYHNILTAFPNTLKPHGDMVLVLKGVRYTKRSEEAMRALLESDTDGSFFVVTLTPNISLLLDIFKKHTCVVRYSNAADSCLYRNFLFYFSHFHIPVSWISSKNERNCMIST